MKEGFPNTPIGRRNEKQVGFFERKLGPNWQDKGPEKIIVWSDAYRGDISEKEAEERIKELERGEKNN
jgi:hypothetical protein